MNNRWRHWCPNGCGKKVVYKGTKVNGKGVKVPNYVCQECYASYDYKPK